MTKDKTETALAMKSSKEFNKENVTTQVEG
jgi:hypothetical protein